MSDDAGEVFRALGDPMRRRIVDLIAEGTATPTGIAGVLPVTRQAVSRHLGVLEAAGVVQHRRRGREVRYQVRPGAVADAARWLTERADWWAERLEALAAHLAGD